MIDVGLKEWASVCELMVEGRAALLLRKGGIHESGGPGVFELEHRRFVLFPSWLHQRPEGVKPALAGRVRVYGQEPGEVTLTGWGEVARVWRVPSRAAFDRLDDLHPWSPQQVDMRFGYKPERPLYLVAVRAWRLPSPRVIANHAEYAGCRSWVPLRPGDGVDESGSTPAIAPAAFEAMVERVAEEMGKG